MGDDAARTPNYERAFDGHRDAYAGWLQLNGAIKAGMDLRRYELVTLAAARALRSSYCALAHGRVLAEQFGEPVVAIATDRRTAGLSDVDVAVMDFAEQVALDAASITDADRQRLRDLGLSDGDIASVTLAAAARCFFSKMLDGVGARADPSFAALPDELKDVLVVGAPIADE